MADDRQLLIKFILQDQTKKGFDAVNKQVKSTRGSFLNLKNAILGVLGSVVVKQALDLANSFQQVQNRLKLVTNSTNELLNVQEKLFVVAQKTRGAFAETVTLYQKLALNSKNLGLNQNQLLTITENVNKAIAISGADSIQASAGILQLSQAFASGRLQGDEFRSISENIPVILDILAQSTGIARGELKKMAGEGKLTSEVLAKALFEATSDLDSQFTKLAPTISQATTVMGNSLLNLVGKIFEATNASTLLSKALIEVSKQMDEASKIVDVFSAISLKNLEEALKEGDSALLKQVYSTDLLDKALQAINITRNADIFGVKTSINSYEELEEKLESLRTTIELNDSELQRFTNRLIEATKPNYSDKIAELDKFLKKNESTISAISEKNKEAIYSDVEFLRYKQDEEVKLINEQTKAILEIIRLKEEGITEITKEEHQKYLEMIENLKREEIGISARYNQELIDLEKKKADEIAKINKQNYDEQFSLFKDGKFAQMDLNKIAEGNMSKFTKDTAVSTLEALAQNNKRAFQINKAYKTAEAIMNTAQGVTKALATGNFILAGIIGAMGFAQVATIQSQQYSGRALGGRVQAGSTYMVGEGGKPEMFVPDQSGTIIPNSKLGGQTNIYLTVNANDTQGFDDLLVKRRSVIVNVINDALNSQGREALI
jgi:tape measure domain-containing protein